MTISTHKGRDEMAAIMQTTSPIVFFNEYHSVLIKISQNFAPNGFIDKKP